MNKIEIIFVIVFSLFGFINAKMLLNTSNSLTLRAYSLVAFVYSMSAAITLLFEI